MNDQLIPNQGYNSQYGNSGQNQKFQKNAKKRKSKTGLLIAIIVIVLALCCGGIGILISLFGNLIKDADPIDFDEFKITMQDLGYSDYAMNSSIYMTFHSDDYSTEIEVQDTSAVDLAISYAETYQELYDIDQAKYKSTVSGKNYERITWNTDDTYYLIYRVDSTLVWVHSPSKDAINELKDKLK